MRRTSSMLQWGHAFVSVETAQRDRGAILVVLASMGPRFCKRGNAVSRSPDRQAAAASMGPRFCKRGNALAGVSDDLGKLQLQWGHAFVSVETGAPSTSDTTLSMLQWGHAFVSVETRFSRLTRYQGLVASMGPRFCKRGNIPSTPSPPPRQLASMGPRFCKRGNEHRRDRDRACDDGASMGPRFCKRGNLTDQLSATYRPVALQWGHAFVSVETASRPSRPTPRQCFNGATLL